MTLSYQYFERNSLVAELKLDYGGERIKARPVSHQEGNYGGKMWALVELILYTKV